MKEFSSLILLDDQYQVLDRKDFEGVGYLVFPVFANYSMKYLQRDLTKEKNAEYLEELIDVMAPQDLNVKLFFDENVLERLVAINALEQLITNNQFSMVTILRLEGYLEYLKKQDGEFVVQQNSNKYPDVDRKIKNGKFHK